MYIRFIRERARETQQKLRDSAIEISGLNENVGEHRLELFQMEQQMSESMDQRVDEMNEHMKIEKLDNDATMKEALGEVERLRTVGKPTFGKSWRKLEETSLRRGRKSEMSRRVPTRCW